MEILIHTSKSEIIYLAYEIQLILFSDLTFGSRDFGKVSHEIY